MVHGLETKEVKITPSAIHEIIRRYTREAGVREMERMLATACRKIARKKAEKKLFKTEIGLGEVRKFLGPAKYSSVLDGTTKERILTNLRRAQAQPAREHGGPVSL